jgi:hypothetical protein
MTMRVAATYANSFGCWQTEIVIDGNATGDDNAAHAMAFNAIEAEIKARRHSDVLHGVTLIRRVSRDGTLTYYFTETDPS